MTDPRPTAGPEVGASRTHRRYVPSSHAHYGGDLVDGAYGLGLFGDVATDLCISTDGDEGLFASYSDVQFLAAVRAGDVVEASATLVAAGNRSRTIEFVLTVVARRRPEADVSSARPLEPPLVATRATGVVVVPPAAVGAAAPDRT